MEMLGSEELSSEKVSINLHLFYFSSDFEVALESIFYYKRHQKNTLDDTKNVNQFLFYYNIENALVLFFVFA